MVTVLALSLEVLENFCPLVHHHAELSIVVFVFAVLLQMRVQVQYTDGVDSSYKK